MSDDEAEFRKRQETQHPRGHLLAQHHDEQRNQQEKIRGVQPGQHEQHLS